MFFRYNLISLLNILQENFCYYAHFVKNYYNVRVISDIHIYALIFSTAAAMKQ